MNDYIYFVVYSNENNATITVVDLQDNMSYERNEFDVVSDINFDNHIDAIGYAREYARLHGLVYDLFESRYNEDLNEHIHDNRIKRLEYELAYLRNKRDMDR